MSKLFRVGYIGEQETLKGKIALARDDPENAARILVQFDLSSVDLSSGWHSFPASDFVRHFENKDE